LMLIMAVARYLSLKWIFLPVANVALNNLDPSAAPARTNGDLRKRPIWPAPYGYASILDVFAAQRHEGCIFLRGVLFRTFRSYGEADVGDTGLGVAAQAHALGHFPPRSQDRARNRWTRQRGTALNPHQQALLHRRGPALITYSDVTMSAKVRYAKIMLFRQYRSNLAPPKKTHPARAGRRWGRHE
jgi:hypothetical protein